jgi:hypothetical protein
MSIRSAILLAAACALTGAATADAKAPVRFAGCLNLRWLEGRCLTVKSNGIVYNLNDVVPRPNAALGRGISGMGIADGKITLCGGTHLASAKWTYTKLKCPRIPWPPRGRK